MGSYSLGFHVRSYWSHISQSFCKLHVIFFVSFCQLTVLGHQQVLSAGRFKSEGPQPPKKEIQWFRDCAWRMATPSAYPWGSPCTFVSVDITAFFIFWNHRKLVMLRLHSLRSQNRLCGEQFPLLNVFRRTGRRWQMPRSLHQWRTALRRDSKNFKSGIWRRIRQIFISFALVFNYFCGHWQYHSLFVVDSTWAIY